MDIVGADAHKAAMLNESRAWQCVIGRRKPPAGAELLQPDPPPLPYGIQGKADLIKVFVAHPVLELLLDCFKRRRAESTGLFFVL